MEQSLGFAKMIERMKEELFSPSANLFALLPVSAYETAWVAMVPDPDDPTSPMFPKYLDWILSSQNALGFWFDEQHGLRFLQDNMEKELMNMRKREEDSDKVGHAHFRRWFLMAELAKAKGLKVFSAQQINNEFFYEFKLNEKKLKSEEDEDIITKEILVMRDIAFGNYGSTLVLQSPSVTACAYMITGDHTYKSYLQHFLTNCQHGVPPMFSMDKDFMKLSVVDHLERLGCAEHFSIEIKHVMDHLYGKWIEEESEVPKKVGHVFQIYNDSLAFRLLRMHGYQVSPRRICWFIDDEKMLSHMKDNYAFFLGPMLSIYKASHIAFLEDQDLDKAGVFSWHILQKGLKSIKSQNETNISYSLKKFELEIEHELEHKWLARMDHLEHRLYIEGGGIYNFWVGKNAPYRILQNNDLLQLAIDNFMMRQSTYTKEIQELRRWSKNTGLSMMGFGREKTTYCYFAMASSSCLPLDTYSRKEATKCAILITVADDFFDEKGSMHELSILADAVQRWEGESLTSHSKVIFTALDNLVQDISLKFPKRHGHGVKKILQNTWKEIFKSWLKEAEWSRSSHYPSIDQYIENATTSIAVDMIILTACYLTNSKVDAEEFWSFNNTMITKSLMISCRLLNDLESYEKEAKAGKPNIVLLYLKENPKAKIDDAIAFVRTILEKRKKELLQMAMSRDSATSQMPREWKDLHLSFLKVFQMFFNSMNAFDSPNMLLDSINKAIYEPLGREMEKKQEEKKRIEGRSSSSTIVSLDHRQTFVRPLPEALSFVGPPLEALTSTRPSPNVVAPPDHHFRLSPPPDHRLTPLLRRTTALSVTPPDHHLRPSPLPDHRLTPLLRQTTT
ncbi:hypothetical protein KFK09_012913 [Dendrobium nobile]|uniref:Uncharacterized protein n=1 Tax=Dendrobium nobile TaxID=94219 RepID=A0A8T3BIQ7_DENNO|nr:hypothetical protein KFK09_012913 [Dendrobium nobile]